MPRWQGKSKGFPAGYRIFVFLCKTLGVTPAYLLLRFVAFYYFLFSWKSTRHSFRFFRQRMGFGVLSSCFKVYQNNYIFGQTLIDKVVVMANIPNRFTFHLDGEHNLRAIVEGKRGGILLSAHVGNWEAAGHMLGLLNTRINVVMYDGERMPIKEYLEGVTGGRNLNVIVLKDDLSHVFAIGEALTKNDLICLHADRFLEGNKTTWVNFLGAPARFPDGPFLTAAAFNVPVSIVFAFKESATHYHFFGSAPVQRQPEESKALFVERLRNTFVLQLEEKIKQYPLQWFNYYDFWAH
jgi:predicted LPLAT superfamily acyltransferase